MTQKMYYIVWSDGDEWYWRRRSASYILPKHGPYTTEGRAVSFAYQYARKRGWEAHRVIGLVTT